MPTVGNRGRFSIAGRNTTTAATADLSFGTFWNNHATADLYVVTLAIHKFSGRTDCTIRRATARGTPASTVTPDIDNDYLKLAAPLAGVLDLGSYSVQPTVDPSFVYRYGEAGAGAGAGLELVFGDGIRIPAGEGLTVRQVAAVGSARDLTFTWDD